MWAQMPPGGSTPTHSRRKLGEPVTRSAGHHALAHRPLVVVAVVDEQVEGGQALDEAGLDDLPLVAGDDPRDDVERPRPVDADPLVVDGEGHADGPDLAVGGHLALGQGAGPRSARWVHSVRRPTGRGSAVGPDQLVEERARGRRTATCRRTVGRSPDRRAGHPAP